MNIQIYLLPPMQVVVFLNMSSVIGDCQKLLSYSLIYVSSSLWAWQVYIRTLHKLHYDSFATVKTI